MLQVVVRVVTVLCIKTILPKSRPVREIPPAMVNRTTRTRPFTLPLGGMVMPVFPPLHAMPAIGRPPRVLRALVPAQAVQSARPLCLRGLIRRFRRWRRFETPESVISADKLALGNPRTATDPTNCRQRSGCEPARAAAENSRAADRRRPPARRPDPNTDRALSREAAAAGPCPAGTDCSASRGNPRRTPARTGLSREARGRAGSAVSWHTSVRAGGTQGVRIIGRRSVQPKPFSANGRPPVSASIDVPARPT
jgi:hypothetical protein